MPNEEIKKEGELNPSGDGKLNPANISAKTEDEDDAEIIAMKDQVAKKIEEKSGPKKMYSEEEMNEIVNRMSKKFSKSQDSSDEEFIDLLDPNAVKRKFVRIPRLNNKFVIGMKDMNKDSYSDQPIYVTNVEHPTKKGEFVPWATFIYDEMEEVPDPLNPGKTISKNKEELYPYLSFMNRAVGVWGEVIDEKKVDISEKFGLIDVKVIDSEDEWNMKSTGKKVLAKALKYRTVYVVKDTKGGKTLNVSEDVVNVAEAPYSELRKFLEDNK